MDDVFGGRVVMTNSPNLDFCSPACGGVSAVGVVDNIGAAHDSNQPSWAFTDGVGTVAKYMGEVISHEFGHAVGLSHDGQIPGVEYYGGHGMWAPTWRGDQGFSPVPAKNDAAGLGAFEDDVGASTVEHNRRPCVWRGRW